MNLSVFKLLLIPFLLGGCDLLFSPCTNLKREVCACDDAGAALCKAAEATEEQAKKYKDDGDDDRHDTMQDSCQTTLDAWDEADGCEQFADGGGGDDDGDGDGGGDGGGGDGGGDGGGGGSSAISCQGECTYMVACGFEDEAGCMDVCLAENEDLGICDGAEAAEFSACMADNPDDCAGDPWTPCLESYPDGWEDCN